MDEASRNIPTSFNAECFSTDVLFGGSDPLAVALRRDCPLTMGELVELYQQTLSDRTSYASRDSLFWFQSMSPIIQPASNHLAYPVPGPANRHTEQSETVATDLSSLSASYGSGSEIDLDATRDHHLVGVGAWTADDPAGTPPLKGSSRVRRRLQQLPVPKLKKPRVTIRQIGDDILVPDDELHVERDDTVVPRNRRLHLDKLDDRSIYGGGRIPPSPNPPPSLPATFSGARMYMVVSLIFAILCTLCFSALAARSTGKARLHCTRTIIFFGTTLVSVFTILAMLIARRALHDALLAGLFEFIVGFALVREIHNLMW